MQDLLTVEEAAQQLRVSPDTIRRLLRDQKLSGVRVGGQWRVPAEALRTAPAPGIDSVLGEQVVTLRDLEIEGVKIPAGTVGYVMRRSTGVGGFYRDTITVRQSPVRRGTRNQFPEIDLNMFDQNNAWKFVSGNETADAVTVPRPLLRDLKAVLNDGYLANTTLEKNATLEQAYLLVRTALGRSERSDDDAILKAIDQRDKVAFSVPPATALPGPDLK